MTIVVSHNVEYVRINIIVLLLLMLKRNCSNAVWLFSNFVAYVKVFFFSFFFVHSFSISQ